MENSSKLNAAQQQAVDHSGGHLLIVAGPGTGKTHTLVHRIARFIPYLKSGQKILAMTLTNKAAREVNDRLMALDVVQRFVCAGTFYAFCLKLLRTYLDRTALPKDFKIASLEDLKDFDSDVRTGISLIKSTQMAIHPDKEFKAYTKTLRQAGLIDFDDILREALELLEDDTIAEAIQQEYPYIFIDEYQDINIVQNALLKRLVGKTGVLTAIGDRQQRIYGFRGANVALFDRFEEDFMGATVLKLHKNYRSSANLLKASLQVIGRAEPDMQQTTQIFTDGKLLIHEAPTDRAEADFVAAQIETMVGGLSLQRSLKAEHSFGDIAICYRLQTQCHVMTQALEHLGIPYHVSKNAQRSQEYSDEAALMQHEDSLDYSMEKVSLLMLHAAKGLEFPVVFIIGCEDKLLPLQLEGMQGDIEEERRLFYVGMTRAKKSLFMTYAKRRQLFGRTVELLVSPFLSDIEENLKIVAASRKKVKKSSDAVDHGQMQLF